jgi:hypothetical protein
VRNYRNFAPSQPKSSSIKSLDLAQALRVLVLELTLERVREQRVAALFIGS